MQNTRLKIWPVFETGGLRNILYTPSTVFPTVFKPKMPYYGLATRAQAIVMKALGTPLKLITQITGISGRHIGNLQ